MRRTESFGSLLVRTVARDLALDVCRTFLLSALQSYKIGDQRIIIEIRGDENPVSGDPTKTKSVAKRDVRLRNQPRGKRDRGIEGGGDRQHSRSIKSKS